MILLTTSGARFGWRATVPHVAGVVLGVGITAGVTGLGLGEVLLRLPALTFTFQCLAAAWILFLAWRLFQSTRFPWIESNDRPFTFFQAVLFQWVNPKVWAIALAAAAGFAGSGGPLSEAARLALTFSGINLFVCVFWVLAGQSMTRVLSRPVPWQVFMTAMAGALALSAGLVFA